MMGRKPSEKLCSTTAASAYHAELTAIHPGLQVPASSGGRRPNLDDRLSLLVRSLSPPRTEPRLSYTAAGGLLITLLLLVSAICRLRREPKRSVLRRLRVSEAKCARRSPIASEPRRPCDESEERYRELVENANDIVFTLDLKGNVLPSIRPSSRSPAIREPNCWA